MYPLLCCCVVELSLSQNFPTLTLLLKQNWSKLTWKVTLLSVQSCITDEIVFFVTEELCNINTVIVLSITVKLFWNSLNCIKRFRNKVFPLVIPQIRTLPQTGQRWAAERWGASSFLCIEQFADYILHMKQN